MSKYVDTRHARSKAYKKELKEIARKKICPFCPKEFKNLKKKVLKRSGNWLITDNNWPYLHSAFHFLIIGKKHSDNISQITSKDLINLLKLAQWAVKKYKISGGAIAMRFGSTSHTGATVVHLHAHLIVPQLYRDGTAKPVLFPIG